MDELIGLKIELMAIGMRPSGTGMQGKKKVEFVSNPWIAGREIFIMVQDYKRPQTARCVGADEIEVR